MKYISVYTVAIVSLFSCTTQDTITRSGSPWNGSVQVIPGKLECEYYNTGGEGIAYHDTDSLNNGSGALNPADGTFLNEFRMNEGVDISYTKDRNIDNTQYNRVAPAMGQFYVGWTKPGEWVRYTVDVKETGNYAVGIMFTSNRSGGIAVTVDGNDISDTITIPSTFHPQDTVSWRQWHHWNYIDSVAEIHLSQGVHVVTLHTVVNGDMNYDYLNFKRTKKQ